METKIVMKNRNIIRARGDNKVITSDQEHLQDQDDEAAVVLPGFRFHPTDEELVGFYLRRKVEKKPLKMIDQLINQADIYKYDPWDLAKIGGGGSSCMTTGSGDKEKEWYFFCKRGRKYKNSVRPNRVTASGFWKATGIDKSVYSGSTTSGDVIGLKKSLVYYRGTAGKGIKTEWMMHEFRLPPATTTTTPMNRNMMMMPPFVHRHATNFAQEAEIWTLCRIFRRTTSYKRCAPVMKLAHFKQQQRHTTYSVSATNSRDSDIIDPYHPTLGGNALAMEYIEQKQPVFDHVLDARSYPLFTGNLNSVATNDPVLLLPNLDSDSWDSSRQEAFFGDWDELRPVVECNLDPFHYNHV